MSKKWLGMMMISLGVLAGLPVQSAQRPNILFILTDDQAPWGLGYSGYAQAATPNLDRLFSEGVYLTHAYTVTPVCSPSRASLMTSRYGSELGITEWIHPKFEADLGLDPSLVTWPELLQKAGYNTALVGKWHLGVPERFHPKKTGFDYFMGFREGGASPVDPTLEDNEGEVKKFKGLTTDILTDHALAWLKTRGNAPFLLCLHYRAPHTRWLPVAPEDWAPFENLDPALPHPDYPDLDVDRVKRMTREYLASIRGVDRNVGRVMEWLREAGLDENTLVVYTSDHGYNMGHNGIWHKGNGHWVLKSPPPFTDNIPKGQRPNMYDHSVRVPTAVRWKGKLAAGQVLQRTVSNLDWFPTLMAAAGVDIPADVPIRGRNALPLLLLPQQPHDWDDTYYGEYSTHHQSHTHMRMIRTPEWKLVRDFLNPDRDELYDLTLDPGETTNLILSRAPHIQQVLDRLNTMLMERMKAIGDKVAKP